MYAIYGNIYHQYTPNVSIYTSTMDPMGYKYPWNSMDATAVLIFQKKGTPVDPSLPF